MSELANWINSLAGDYVENWVGEQIAEVWQKDKDRIAELELKIETARKALDNLDFNAAHAALIQESDDG